MLLFTKFESKTGISSLRSTKEIEANDFSLAIPLYVDKKVSAFEDEGFTAQDIYSKWFASLEQSEKALISLLIQFPEEEIK